MLHLVTFVTCYPLRTILAQKYLLPIISVLAENTLLKTTCHDASTLLDNTVPLREFLDEQLARVRENEITETDDIIETGDYDSP